MMTNLSSVSKLLSRTKIILRGWTPYFSHVFTTMRTVETTEVPTMAVDQTNRLYCNRAFMESLGKLELAYVLLHEVMHVVLGHCKRLRTMVDGVITERERYCWNLAADLVVQQMLFAMWGSHEPKGIVSITGSIPGTETRYLSVTGLRRGMSVEQYYTLLFPYIPEQPAPNGSKIDPLNAGSGSDGMPKDYEVAPTVAEQAICEHAIQEAAVDVERQESMLKGSVPGDLVTALKYRLRKQPDPFDLLRSIVSRSVASPIGQEEFTFRRMSRRQRPDGVRRKGVVRYAPECSIIIDTSGSMTGYEDRAMTAIAQGLRKVQRPRVVAWDTKCQSAKRLATLSQFEFKGYGGTSMDRAVVEEDKEHRPDVIVLVTDGETSWPTKRTRAKLVIALVKKGDCCAPAWAKLIDLTKEVANGQ